MKTVSVSLSILDAETKREAALTFLACLSCVSTLDIEVDGEIVSLTSDEIATALKAGDLG